MNNRKTIDLSYFIRNGEWDLYDTGARIVTLTYPEGSFQELHFSIIISRSLRGHLIQPRKNKLCEHSQETFGSLKRGKTSFARFLQDCIKFVRNFQDDVNLARILQDDMELARILQDDMKLARILQDDTILARICQVNALRCKVLQEFCQILVKFAFFLSFNVMVSITAVVIAHCRAQAIETVNKRDSKI